MSELPPGWSTARLDEISFIQMGQSPDSRTYNEDGLGLPFYQGKAEFGMVSPTARKWCSEPKKIAEPEDILMSIRAPVGPTNIASETCCIGRGLAAIRTHPPMNRQYVGYALKKLEPWLSTQGTGSTFSAISGDFVRSLKIPVAPLNEQKRIADKLDTLLARVEACRERLLRVQEIIKRFRQAVLEAACEGRLVPTEAELARAEGRTFEHASELLKRILLERRARWEAGQPGEVRSSGGKQNTDSWKDRYPQPAALDVTNGQLLPCGWCHATVDHVLSYLRNGTAEVPNSTTGVPVLRISAVRPLSVNLDDVRYLNSNFDDAKSIIRPGDLLFTRYNGNPDFVGVCGVVPPHLDKIAHPDKLIRGVLIEPLVSSRFMQITLNVGRARDFLRNRIRTTAGQAGVSGLDIKATPFLLPPVVEQLRIAAKVERLLSIVEGVETTVNTNLSLLDRLHKTLLDNAFCGDLVPQDPNDEPAEAMLERIKAERDASASPVTDKGKNRKLTKRPLATAAK